MPFDCWLLTLEMLDRLPGALKSAWIPVTAGIGERISGVGYVVVWFGVDVVGASPSSLARSDTLGVLVRPE